jgi:hypothetical protein
MPLSEYVLSLCNAVNQQPNLTLGITLRLSSQNSSFERPAHKVIHSLVTYSPAPESVSVEFLNELEKVSSLKELGNLPVNQDLPLPNRITVCPVLARQSELDCREWSLKVVDILAPNPAKQLKKKLHRVIGLATEYLLHLLIAGTSLHPLPQVAIVLISTVRNPGGTKMPQVSAHPSPDLSHILAIQHLLDEAVTGRSQGALKKLHHTVTAIFFGGGSSTIAMVTSAPSRGGISTQLLRAMGYA